MKTPVSPMDGGDASLEYFGDVKPLAFCALVG